MHSESVAPSSSMATSQGRIATGPFDTPLVLPLAPVLLPLQHFTCVALAAIPLRPLPLLLRGPF